MRAPRIYSNYSNTSPAGVRGSFFRWFFDPWTPAGLVLVYILGSRIEHCLGGGDQQTFSGSASDISPAYCRYVVPLRHYQRQSLT